MGKKVDINITYKEKKTMENRRYKLGITISEYDALFLSQDGKCAICKRVESVKYKGKTKSLAVDHDHKTGKIRGLLCQRCNVALGLLKDNADYVYNMLKYLDHKRVRPKKKLYVKPKKDKVL